MSAQQSPVYLFKSEDENMVAAIKQARQTFRFFWRELAWERRRIVPGLDLACVKLAFWDPDGPSDGEHPDVEQMWINDVDFDGKTVSGTLINSPNWLTSVAEGDFIESATDRISDWMYSISEKVYGAFTVNTMRAQMSRQERAEHDAAWGLDFGDPGKVRIVPPEFIGQKQPGFFSRLLGGDSGSQDPSEVAAMEHPMALNMIESLEEFVQSDPANLTDADDKGFTLMHQLALAGAAQGVAMLLKHGADPNVVAKNGMTPKQLAKALGWQNVVSVIETHGS